MKNNLKRPLYNCSQNELYAACQIGWTSLEVFLLVFTSKKAFYNADFLTSARAEVDAAQALPDSQARSGVSELVNKEMKFAARECRVFWRLLKSYIISAYDKETVDTRLDIAGATNYLKASQNNWEDVSALIIAGNTFIAEKESELLANDNMPSTFPADYTNTMNIFLQLYKDFKKSESEASNKTQIKVQANNAIFKKLMAMFKDGQLFFDKDPSTKQRFIFDQVLLSVSSPGAAGLGGTIINAETGAGLAGATLSLFEGTNILVTPKYTTHTAANGGYNFGAIPSGKYTLKMEHAGFVTHTEKVTIKKGVASSKTFMMNP